MATLPRSVADFLAGRTLAVAGVSRTGGTSAANPVFRKLRESGYDVVPVNPAATEVEGVTCYRDLASIGRPLDGVVIATHPRVTLSVVEQCGALGVTRVWMHRSVGQGSVSEDAVRYCAEHGISCIAGGCPLMFCEPVDAAHRCMRWLFQWMGRVPR